MSKKKNRKKQQYKYFGSALDNSKKSKKGKKSKGSKTVGYKEPKLTNIQPTLDKGGAKECRKIIQSPVDIPKEFQKNRRKCNHAAGTMSVAEFKAITPNYAAYTPALEQMVAKYGEENVRICRRCYDAVVARDAVDQEKVIDAMTTLYAACNVAVSNKRMKKDEVQKFAKLKESTEDFRLVVDILQKIKEAEAVASATKDGMMAGMNINPGAAYMG